MRPAILSWPPATCARAGLAVLVAAAALLAAAGSAAASSKRPEPELDGSISFEQGYTDNVRGDHIRRDGAWFSQLDAEGELENGLQSLRWLRRASWLPDRIGALMRARVYASYGNRDYGELGPSFGWDWKRVSFDLDYLYSPDRLRVEPESSLDAFADGHDLTGEVRSKFGKNKRWTALGSFQFEADFYDKNARGRSYYEEEAEVGLRCRANQFVTPRAGFAYSWRDAISSNYDREEAKMLLGFDVFLPYEARATFRYEKIWRNFLVGNQRDASGHRNTNYGREDDAYEIETGLDIPIPWIDSTSAHVIYRRYDNSSSREDRIYYVNEGTLRFSYDF